MRKSFIVLLILITISSTLIVASESNVVNLRDWVKVQIVSPIEENGGVPVNIQDQTTTPVDIRVNQILNENITLASSPIINSYELTLTAGHGVIVGNNLAVLEQNGIPRLFFGTVDAVNVNIITMNSPVPYNFTPSSSRVFTFNNDFSVDGSVDEQIFTITNFFADDMDITRFIFHCLDETSMDDAKFCGLPELSRGITIRRRFLDGTYMNMVNIKTNGDWAEFAFDKAYDAKAPAGFYGFSSRLTYAGLDKHGVAIRLQSFLSETEYESIELVIQDDLTGLTKGSLMVQGHFVQS